MKSLVGALAIGAAVVALAPVSASARHLHHHHQLRAHRAWQGHSPNAAYAPSPYGGYGAGSQGSPSQEPLGSGYYNPYVGYQGPGSIVLNATERARREPGVTLELAPDAKETATGGPVGGVPGHEGP